MPIKTDKIIVVDLEATCWPSFPPKGQTNEIIEIGICLVNLKKKEIERKDSYFVKPLYSEISAYCMELTTITPDMIKKSGKPLNEVVNTIAKEYPLKSNPWSSWGEYDRTHFEKECLSKGIPYPFSNSHINIKNIHAICMGTSKGVGVQKAIQSMHMDFIGTQHRGVDDAYNTARILLRILDGFSFK